MNLESKISKICWNSEGWKFPSGSKGKSTDSNSYEVKAGYGHEEWLFDKSRIIDGYHYAFLQPLNLKTDKHVSKIYNISLFAITNGNKYFVGEIKNAECVARKNSREIYEIYKQQKWLKEMSKEIEISGADPKSFIDTHPGIFFNIRFKFKDVYKPDELEQISKEDRNITTTRFKLLNKKADFKIETEIQEDETNGNLRNTEIRKRIYKGEGKIDPYHDKMQNAIYELLTNSYKNEYKKVCIEKDKVDIKAKTHNAKWHYFEIKTDSPKLSIRKAIGQIMEYSYWPDLERAEKLIIVADGEPDLETQNYLIHIRNKFNIPISYRFFNVDTNILSKDH